MRQDDSVTLFPPVRYQPCVVPASGQPGLLLHRQDRKYPVETYSLLHQNQSGKPGLVRRLPCGIRYCTLFEPPGKPELVRRLPCGIRYCTSSEPTGKLVLVRRLPCGIKYCTSSEPTGKLVLVRRLPSGIRYCTSSQPTVKLTLCMETALWT